MEHFSSRVIFIMAISNMFELGLVAGLGHHEFAHASLGDPGFRDGSIQSQEKPAVRSRSFQFVPSIGIQDSKELNKTCCLNGGTCILGSFCACPASFYGRNCEHDVQKENCGSVSHGAWLPKKCSLCKCWHGQFRCFPQAFISGCESRVMEEHLAVSRTPELAPSAWTTLMLAGLCLSIQSYC
uniref:teratocarcinoma-derived growth factor 1 n=1 Tax=Ictidomys tridecemlineatus TaxID=43179 RepID=UPI001AA006D6|nr:teratocarcinoma-derived growth factor 1 [Ictidomys tridecemlineatus]